MPNSIFLSPIITLLTIVGLFISPLALAVDIAKPSTTIVQEPANNSVATVVPIAHSLLMQLLKDTNVDIHYLPPKRLPINRLTNWVATNASKIHPKVSAIIGIDAMRPELSFYTALRKENIHTINIDIAKALMPGGEQVAIYQKNRQGYFWLNINNALLMTGILRRDLTATFPEFAKKINENAATISKELRQVSMQLDEIIFEKNIEQLVIAQEEFADFAASFPLPIVTLTQAKSNDLTTLYITKIKTKIPKLSNNIRLWAIDDFSKTHKTSFIDRWLNTTSNLAL